MEDISGDQWEHFAAVSRNGSITQDFSIQQHSPAHSERAPLGPDDGAGARVRVARVTCAWLRPVFSCINFTVYKWATAALGALTVKWIFWRYKDKHPANNFSA